MKKLRLCRSIEHYVALGPSFSYKTDLKSYGNRKLFLKGFTLFELLLVMSITGVILLTVYSGFALGLKVYKRVKESASTEAAAILTQLSQELRSAYLFFQKDSNLWFIGSPSSLRFITVASLRDNFDAPGEFDLREVSYYLIPSVSKNMRSLVYRVTLDPGKNSSERREERILTERAKSLEFAYYDGESWQRAWNSTENLPQAVRIDIEFSDMHSVSYSESFSTIVDMSFR